MLQMHASTSPLRAATYFVDSGGIFGWTELIHGAAPDSTWQAERAAANLYN